MFLDLSFVYYCYAASNGGNDVVLLDRAGDFVNYLVKLVFKIYLLMLIAGLSESIF